MSLALFQKNLALFKRRFPQLFALHSDAIEAFDFEKDCVYTALTATRDGLLSACDATLGRPLLIHSRYYIEKEVAAELSLVSASTTCAVFLGFGLGYAPMTFAKEYCEKALILIEPSLMHFLSALGFVDWSQIFSHKALAILLAPTVDECIAVLLSHDLSSAFIAKNSAQMSHADSFFSSLLLKIDFHIKKEKINKATAKRFAPLWHKNCLLNAPAIKKLGTIEAMRGAFPTTSFCVIAAGPSLAELLPQMSLINERCVTVAVDSALFALLNNGTPPDYAVITDSQRAAFLHIAQLSAPNTVLLAPIEAPPQVFRAKFKKILAISSAIEEGVALQGFSSSFANLGAGGSVACSALNFAIFCQGAGSAPIYLAGLDLSFPANFTHIKGAAGETAALAASNRLSSATTSHAVTLFLANLFFGSAFDGSTVLTDDKMSTFAFYIAERLRDAGRKNVFSLNPKALAIEGVGVAKICDLIAQNAKVTKCTIDNSNR